MLFNIFDIFKTQKFYVIQSGYLAKRALELDEEYQRAKEGAEAIKKVVDEVRKECEKHAGQLDFNEYALKLSHVTMDYMQQADSAISYRNSRDELLKLIDEREEVIHL